MIFSSFIQSLQQKVSGATFQSLLGLLLVSILILSCWHLMNLFLVFSNQFRFAFEYQLTFFVGIGVTSLAGFIYLFRGASLNREAILILPLSLAEPKQIAAYFFKSVIRGYFANSRRQL